MFLFLLLWSQRLCETIYDDRDNPRRDTAGYVERFREASTNSLGINNYNANAPDTVNCETHVIPTN